MSERSSFSSLESELAETPMNSMRIRICEPSSEGSGSFHFNREPLHMSSTFL